MVVNHVQLVMLVSLTACMAIPCVMFYKLLPASTPSSRFPRFVAVEAMVLVAAFVTLGILWWPPAHAWAFIWAGVLLAMLANIPAALIAKLVGGGPGAAAAGRSIHDDRPTAAMCECPGCGQQVGVQFGNCPLCNAELPSAEKEEQGERSATNEVPAEKKHGRRIWLTCAGCGGVTVLVLCSVFLAYAIHLSRSLQRRTRYHREVFSSARSFDFRYEDQVRVERSLLKFDEGAMLERLKKALAGAHCEGRSECSPFRIEQWLIVESQTERVRVGIVDDGRERHYYADGLRYKSAALDALVDELRQTAAGGAAAKSKEPK